MPRIPPARPRTRPNTPDPVLPGLDWCSICYQSGQSTLAAGHTGLCIVHGGPGAAPDRDEHARADLDRRSGPDHRRPAGRRLSPKLAHARARRRAAGLAYGRRRAAVRVRTGRYLVHPGWRGRVPDRMRVIADQRTALQRVAELVDAQLWSPRQRREWTAMLEHMVHAMDWDTGLIAGVTREHLATLTGRSPTTVSRMWAWAQETGLLARVEEGALGQWLGTEHNRAAAFVITAPQDREPTALPQEVSEQLTQPVDQNGNHPTSCVSSKPLDGSRSPSTAPQLARWASWQIPTTPAERARAATELLTRIGLERPSSAPRQRVHGLLRPWWDQGWCVIGLLHAIDHDPDGNPLGDAIRGARDPLATIGARLARWRGRHQDLPTYLRGVHGDYRAAQAARLASHLRQPTTPAPANAPAASAAARVAARNTVRDHLQTSRRRRAPGLRRSV